MHKRQDASDYQSAWFFSDTSHMILIKFGIGEFTPQVVKEIQFWFVTV
jgi:hypothetical protein